MDVKLLYNPGERKFRSVGEKMLEWEPCPSRGWAPRPPVEQSRRTGKKCCYSQKSWGFNMLQFCSVSNSPLTNNTFRNPFEPFQIKWEVYFSKELCPLVFIVLNMFLHESVCEYVTGWYTIIIKNPNQTKPNKSYVLAVDVDDFYNGSIFCSFLANIFLSSVCRRWFIYEFLYDFVNL